MVELPHWLTQLVKQGWISKSICWFFVLFGEVSRVVRRSKK